MRNAFVLFVVAVAVVLGYLTPAQASQRQRLFQRQRQQQNHKVQQVRIVERQVVRHHNNAQQVQAVYLPAQQFRVVPVQAVNAGCHNDNAGVLQLNGGCSALYR